MYKVKLNYTSNEPGRYTGKAQLPQKNPYSISVRQSFGWANSLSCLL